MKVLLLLLLLPLMPAKVEQLDIQCPGANTVEIRWCASQQWKESKRDLQEKLLPETVETWTEATRKVCAAAYAPYRQGTSYPQMVVGLDDRLNRVLLEGLNGLDELDSYYRYFHYSFPLNYKSWQHPNTRSK